MHHDDEERFTAELRRAFADPVAETALAERVRGAVGEPSSEISVTLPRRPSWPRRGLVAAAIVVAGFVAAAVGGAFHDEPAPVAAAGEPPIRIEISPDLGREVFTAGRRRSLAELHEFLCVEADRDRDDRGLSNRDVLLVADSDARWQMVQWVMQECASREVRLYRLWFALPAEGEALVRPAFLPTDHPPAARRAGPEPIRELRADSDAPFEEIVRTVDRLRREGATEIHFVVTKPPEDR